MIQRGAQFLVGDENTPANPAEAKTLVESHQMRRGVDVDPQPGSFENGAQERHRRPLAVGAGDVNDGWNSFFGMIETRENAPHAIEREIDTLGVQ